MTDNQEIREIIEHWAKAVRDEDIASVCADHDPDILMFDVPPPFLSRGLEAYAKTWDMFFSSQERPVTFDLRDVAIFVGADVASATAIGNCVNIDQSGRREPLEFRLTMGFRKIDGKWLIVHEHHSLPAT